MRGRLHEFLKLRKLRASDLATEKAYDRDRKKAKAENKGWEEMERIHFDERSERSIDQDQISKIQTTRLCAIANRIGVPIPTEEDRWEESQALGGRYLSAKGFSELRNAIRKEKNDRWAYWELRIKVFVGLATAITGAAGALIGLASVLGWKVLH